MASHFFIVIWIRTLNFNFIFFRGFCRKVALFVCQWGNFLANYAGFVATLWQIYYKFQRVLEPSDKFIRGYQRVLAASDVLFRVCG
jgi:hypothetical protein